MEKKKLLLVAISVGLFLVIAIGAALLVFAPKNTATASASPVTTRQSGINPPSYQPVYPGFVQGASPEASGQDPGQDPSGQDLGIDPVELVRRNEDVPGLRPLPEGSLRRDSEFRINGQGESGTMISVAKPSSAAVPEAPPTGKAVSPAARPVAQRPAASVAPAAAPREQAAPKPAVQTKLHDDYWVQTGAFSTITNAETVKENLSSRGITSIIENRDVNGATLFRVRVGPYTSQNEANYWLSLIKSIGFEDSQVRMSQSRR
jgi:DedD protein